jgi:hypothetical protein
MTCTCLHPCNYLLPCVHVLAANRAVLGDVFQIAQIHKRWHIAYMPPAQNTFSVARTDIPSVNSTITTIASDQVVVPKHSHDRYAETMAICKKLGDIASTSDTYCDTISHQLKSILLQFNKPAQSKSGTTVIGPGLNLAGSNLQQIPFTNMLPPAAPSKKGRPKSNVKHTNLKKLISASLSQ